ncbi:MAG: Oxidoreductase [Gemmataceae bacterium]|nr:Oxidoreductase [Gemmataceae bacterium]
MEQDFAGKVTLVTGGGSGIGRAAAILFARRGAKVSIAGRRSAELDSVVTEIEAIGGTALAVPTDVSDPAQVAALVERTVARFGRLDAAFNNAGTEGAWGPIGDLSVEDFEATVGVNLRGVWLCCRAEVVQMQRQGQGGAIVNTSSWLAHGALPGSSLYSASKAALDGMARALAVETAKEGIRVNNVNPGVIETAMTRRFVDETTQIPFTNHTPARRLGQADEVAQVAVFLCSGGASFVTGQNILVDGAYTIGGHRPWLSGGELKPQ